MITIRKSASRGHFNHGWLKTHHTFSFGDYHDPQWMGFRSLRVINEDWVQPAMGFGTHPHHDMEIVTYVLGGALEHKDSMGNGSVIRPGDMQRMSAGTGVTHSEFNHSSTDSVHLLQIWILPEKKGIAPGYEQINISKKLDAGNPVLIASPDGQEGSVTIHQNAKIWAARLKANANIDLPLQKPASAWVQVARGNILLNTQSLEAGDGAALTDEDAVHIQATSDSEVLIFELH